MKCSYFALFYLLLATTACDEKYSIPHATVLLSIDLIETEVYSARSLAFHYMRTHEYAGADDQGSISGFSLEPDMLDAGDAGHVFDLSQPAVPLTLYAGTGAIEAIGPRLLQASIFNKRTNEVETIETCVPYKMVLDKVTDIEEGATYRLSLTMDLNEIHVIDGVRAIDFTDQVPTLSRE